MRIDEIDDTHLFEMSNLRKQDTGLPVNVYVSSGGSVNNQHGPRIKAMIHGADRMNPRETVSVILKRDIRQDDVIGYHQLPQSTIASLREFINTNYTVLLQYWNDEISTVEMISGIRKV